MRIAVLLLVVLSVSCRHRELNPDGPRAPGNWELLGQRMVNHHAERDVILAGLQGTFRRIRIDVDRADLEMWDIRVHFGNGEMFSPEVRHHFRDGSWSRIIDLPGAARVITKVEFVYRTAHRGEGRAKVELWGMH